MPEASTLLLFATAALVLLITPGPAVVYIVTRSLDQGRLAGIVSTLGLSVGGTVHVVAAAFGLSALLASSEWGFRLVQLAGAGYLVFLGVRTLRQRREDLPSAELRAEALHKVFLDGVLVNLLNPKAALFIFAFLPQFVRPAGADPTLQILFLGLVFVGLGFVTDTLYAVLAGGLGHWLRRSSRFLAAQKTITGLLYVGLGLAAAFASGQPRARS